MNRGQEGREEGKEGRRQSRKRAVRNCLLGNTGGNQQVEGAQEKAISTEQLSSANLFYKRGNWGLERVEPIPVPASELEHLGRKLGP